MEYYHDVCDGCIDELDLEERTYCLIDNETNEDVDTFIKEFDDLPIELVNYNKTTGWCIDWNGFGADCRVFGLFVEIPDEDGDGVTEEIEGLIALGDDEISIYSCQEVRWICSAPWNRSRETGGTGEKRYYGVGYHLFRIAYDYSLAQDYDGTIWGKATCQDVMNYYCKQYGAKNQQKYDERRRLIFTIAGSLLEYNMEYCTYDMRGVVF